GFRAAHRLVLPISAHIQPGHPQVVAMTEAVMLQGTALERPKECVVVHGHTVDSTSLSPPRNSRRGGGPGGPLREPPAEGRERAHHSEYVGCLIVRPGATARCGVRPSAPGRR